MIIIWIHDKTNEIYKHNNKAIRFNARFLLRVCAVPIRCVFVDVCFVYSSFVCIFAFAYIFKSKVHCGSAVRFGQALPGYPITAHHLYAFLLYLDC